MIAPSRAPQGVSVRPCPPTTLHGLPQSRPAGIHTLIRAPRPDSGRYRYAL